MGGPGCRMELSGLATVYFLLKWVLEASFQGGLVRQQTKAPAVQTQETEKPKEVGSKPVSSCFPPI